MDKQEIIDGIRNDFKDIAITDFDEMTNNQETFTNCIELIQNADQLLKKYGRETTDEILSRIYMTVLESYCDVNDTQETIDRLGQATYHLMTNYFKHYLPEDGLSNFILYKMPSLFGNDDYARSTFRNICFKLSEYNSNQIRLPALQELSESASQYTPDIEQFFQQFLLRADITDQQKAIAIDTLTEIKKLKSPSPSMEEIMKSWSK